MFDIVVVDKSLILYDVIQMQDVFKKYIITRVEPESFRDFFFKNSDDVGVLLFDVDSFGLEQSELILSQIIKNSSVSIIISSSDITSAIVDLALLISSCLIIDKNLPISSYITSINHSILQNEKNRSLKRANRYLELSQEISSVFTGQLYFYETIHQIFKSLVSSELFLGCWLLIKKDDYFDGILWSKDSEDNYFTEYNGFGERINPILNQSGSISEGLIIVSKINLNSDFIFSLADESFGSIISELKVHELSYGYMGVQIKKKLLYDFHEKRLFKRLVNEVGYGLDIYHKKLEERKKDVEMRLNIERFKVAFMISPEPMSMSEIDTGQYIEVNKSFEKITGYSKEELIGSTSFDIGIWADIDERNYIIEEINKYGKIENFPCNFVAKDKSVHTIVLSAQLITIGFRPILLAITRINEYWENFKDGLIKQEAFFALVANQIKQITYEHFLHNDEMKLQGAIEAVTGYEKYELEQIKNTEWQRLIHPDDYEKYKEGLDNREYNDVLYAQYRIKTKDNGYKYIEERYSVLKGVSRVADRRIGVVFDNSEKMEANNQIRAKNEQLKLIMDSAPVAIWSFDLELNIVSLFGAGIDLLSLSSEDLIGKNVRNLANLFQIKDLQLPNYEEIMSGERNSGSVQFNNRMLNIFIEVERDKFDLPKGFMAITFDITENIKMEEQNQLLSKVLENSPFNIMITDNKGIIQYANPFFLENSGYTESEVLGKNPKFLKSGNTANTTYRDLWKTITSGRVWRGEFQNLRKDGTLFTENAIISPIINARFEITNYIAIKEDVTELNKIKDTLTETTEWLGVTLDVTNTVIYKYNYEAEMYDYMSSAITKLTEYNIDELNSIGFKKIVLQKIVNSEIGTSKGYSKGDKKYFTGGWRGDYLIETKLGKQRWLSDHAYSYWDANGGVTYSLGILQDISDRKSFESELRIQRSKTEQLLMNSPIPIVQLDENHKILLVNDSFEALFGYKSEEIIGKHLQETIIPEEYREESLKRLDTLFESGKFNIEAVRVKKDGTAFVTQIFGLLIKTGEQVVGSFRMYIDQTEKIKHQQEIVKAKIQAEEMSTLKSHLLANISHELRTPMNGILGFAELLRTEFEDQNVINMANRLYLSAERLLDTLNLIIDFANLEVGLTKYELQLVDLVPLIHRVCKIFRITAELKGLRLDYDAPSRPVLAQVDENYLRVVVSNLIKNAVKFTNLGGVSVSIRIEQSDGLGQICIDVKDTGIGISTDATKIIFDEFRQVSEGISRSYEGLGLGLTIAKKFAERMGGNISFSSVLGEGSIFTMTLPLMENV